LQFRRQSEREPVIFGESFLLRDLTCRWPLLTQLAEDALHNVPVRLLCLLSRPESFAVEMLVYVGERVPSRRSSSLGYGAAASDEKYL
jgi:hypothetical protein